MITAIVQPNRDNYLLPRAAAARVSRVHTKHAPDQILMTHTSLEGHLGYEKCLQGSVNGFWALLMGYFENQLSPKY